MHMLRGEGKEGQAYSPSPLCMLTSTCRRPWLSVVVRTQCLDDYWERVGMLREDNDSLPITS